jgi:hypothetical protein
MARVLVPEQNVEKLIKSGEYEFPEGTQVNVFNPEGKLVSIPAEQVREALESGYRLESNYEKNVRLAAEKLSGTNASALKVFAAQAADEFALGLPEVSYDITGDPFYIDVKEKIKERHKIANTLGGITGFAASFLYGGPVAKLGTAAAKAGIGASELAAKGAGILAAKVGASPATITKASESLIAQGAKNAVKYGVEGVVSAAPLSGTMLAAETVNSFQEDKIINPSAAAETLLLGGGLGIVTGAGLGALGKVTKKWKAKHGSVDLGLPSDNMFEQGGIKTSPTGEIPGNPNSLVNQAKSLGASDSALKNLAEAENEVLQAKLGKISKSKILDKDYSKIIKAHERLGIPDLLLEEQLAKNAQADAEFIMNSQSKAGEIRREKLAKIFDTLEDTVKSVFKVDETSAFETGMLAKKKLLDFAESNKKKLGQTFKELQLEMSAIPIDRGDLESIKKTVTKELEATFSKNERSILGDLVTKIDNTLSENVKDDAFKFNSVSDVKTAKTAVGKLIATSDAGERAAAKRVYALLSDLEEKTIDKATENVLSSIGEKDANLASGLRNDLKSARDGWKAFVTTLESASDDLGLGAFTNPDDFIAAIQDAEPILLARKLAPPDRVLQIQRLQKEFPDIFEAVKQLKKNELLNRMGYGENINIRRLVSNSGLKKISKEELALYFTPDEIQKLQDVTAIVDSLPSRYTQDAFTSNTTRVTQQLSSIAEALSNPIAAFKGLAETLNLNQAENNIIRAIREESGAIAANLRDVGMEAKQIRKIVEGLIYAEDKVSTLGKIIKNAADLSDISAKKLKDLRIQIQNLWIRETAPKQENSNERFQKLKKRIAAIASNPDVALMENIEDLDAMRRAGLEKTTDEMVGKIATIVRHLQDVMPKGDVQFDSFRPFKGELVSDAEKNKFLRRIDVLNDPFKIVENVIKGTLTKEEIETASIAYPTLIGELKKRMIDSLIQNKPVLTYSQRLNFSLMLGVNLDSTLDSFQLLELQKGMNNLVAQEANKSHTVLKRSSAQSKIPATYQTEVQRIENRA